MGERIVVRASPRIIAPDWKRRLTQPAALILVVLAVLLVVQLIRLLRDPANYITVGVGLAFLLAIFAIPAAAKVMNARLVITPDHVESRDALRRTRRCDRNRLAALVVVRSKLSKVLLLDPAGKAQLSLAWDSYSDDQLDQIRRLLGLPDSPQG